MVKSRDAKNQSLFNENYLIFGNGNPAWRPSNQNLFYRYFDAYTISEGLAISVLHPFRRRRRSFSYCTVPGDRNQGFDPPREFLSKNRSLLRVTFLGRGQKRPICDPKIQRSFYNAVSITRNRTVVGMTSLWQAKQSKKGSKLKCVPT